MRKIAMITGASSGIGKATATKFAEMNYDLIITGRRCERLDEFAVELGREYGVYVLPMCFDVSNYPSVTKAVGSISGKWKNISVLVNNAGLALGLQPIEQGNVDDWDTMIDTNIKGILYMTRLISPLMVKKKDGHIINICSIAGKEAYANGNVYCATKHAVDALTKSMRIDLVKHGIRVSQVSPGAVETEFSLVRFKGDKSAANAVYKGFKPLTAKDVAETVYFCAAQPEHVNINDVIIMPSAQANATTIHRG